MTLVRCPSWLGGKSCLGELPWRERKFPRKGIAILNITTMNRSANGAATAARVGHLFACGLCLAGLACNPALANNGLDLIGFGAESAGMAGADIAVARDTSALNTNPAGLTQIRGRALDLTAAAAYALDVGHNDGYGNDARVSNHWIPIGNLGYAQSVSEYLTIGLGMFAQGGAGNVFRTINTAFGTNDELSSLFGAAKLTAGLGYRVDPQLSVGAAVSLIHAEARQRFFPNTSALNALDPSKPFFGLRLEGATANRAGLKLGVRYAATDALTLAATYTSKTPLPLSDGNLVVNLSARGLGSVTYRDVRIEGLGFPQEVALGAALQHGPTLWSVKLAWLDWAGAMAASTLTASNPDNPLAPPLSQTQANEWKSQAVIAIGMAHTLDARTTLWAGFNYGRNPVPAGNANPLLAAIGERHLTFGASRQIDDAWRFGGAIEYQPGAKLTYTNPALPFGPGAEERNRYIAFHAMLSRRW